MPIGQSPFMISVTVFISDPILYHGQQRNVARSSTKAEYRSLAHTTAEICLLTYLLRDLHIPLTAPPTLHCDNLSALAIATNPLFHAQTKHVEIDYHFIRELVLLKHLSLWYSAPRIKQQIYSPSHSPPSGFVLFLTNFSCATASSVWGEVIARQLIIDSKFNIWTTCSCKYRS